MTKALLYVVALMIFCSCANAFAVSFGKLPDFLKDENSEQLIPPEDMLVEKEEEIDLSQLLTLEQCIKIALKRSSGMKTARLGLIQEDMNVSDARSSYLPQISTSGSYQFSDAVDFGWEKENYDASASARYTIWDQGQRGNQLSQAKLRREAQHSSYDQTGQSLIFNIIKAYYNILETEKLIRVDEQLLEQSKQNVEKIKAFVEAGLAIESDIATARVQQASDELSLINDMNNLELAKANMADLMGLDSKTPLKIVDPPDYEQYIRTGILENLRLETRDLRPTIQDSEREKGTPVPEAGGLASIPMEDAIAQALANRPELKVQKTNLAIQKLNLTLAQLDRWPSITADCGYNVMLDDYLRERDAFKNYKSWNVSARMSYPLFDGGRTSRAVKKSDINVQRTIESISELERSITLEVYQTYLSLDRAKKSLDIARVQVEDAKMSLDVSQGRYEQQMIILLELLDAQVRYARALTNQVKAFYDYKVAERSLEKAVGVLR